VAEGQAILREAGIDPIFGLENLIWAPMRVKRQHHGDTLRGVVDALKRLKMRGAPREQFVKRLRALGNEAQLRTDTKKRLPEKPPKAKSTQYANPPMNAAPGKTTEKPMAKKPQTAQNANSEPYPKSADPANNAAQLKKKTQNPKKTAEPEEEA
jgi:hypothetical protein